jgi:hypothetical protein
MYTIHDNKYSYNSLGVFSLMRYSEILESIQSQKILEAIDSKQYLQSAFDNRSDFKKTFDAFCDVWQPSHTQRLLSTYTLWRIGADPNVSDVFLVTGLNLETKRIEQWVFYKKDQDAEDMGDDLKGIVSNLRKTGIYHDLINDIVEYFTDDNGDNQDDEIEEGDADLDPTSLDNSTVLDEESSDLAVGDIVTVSSHPELTGGVISVIGRDSHEGMIHVVFDGGKYGWFPNDQVSKVQPDELDEARRDFDWYIIPATMTLYQARVVDIYKAISEWGKGTIYVCSKVESKAGGDKERMLFVASSGTPYYKLGQEYHAGHDQTGASKGYYKVINRVYFENNEIVSKDNDIGLNNKASVAVFK